MDCAILQASDRSPKKSQILLDFRDQLVEIFSANFAKKQLVKTANFVGIFWANIGRILIDFTLI